VADLPGAQILRLGRKAEECVDPAVREQLHRLDLRAGDDLPDICGGVEPDMGGYGGQEHVWARAQALHADVFAFEVGDAADAFPREQFEAADVNAGQQDDRFTGVDCGDEIRGITQAEIHLVCATASAVAAPGVSI